MTFIGEASATACKNLVDRAVASGRPVRILHVTDFDPAGRDMPISAAVKIDFFAKKSGVDLDIQLEHVALTEEQCIRYELPRTPIKESEMRGASFEARYGAGATELDALEALHPGALREILVEHIDRYYDHGLDVEVKAAIERYTQELVDADEEVEDQFAEQIEDINDQRDTIWEAFRRVDDPARAAYDRVVGEARAAYDRVVEEAGATYDAALEQARDEIKEMEDRLVTEAEALFPEMKSALEEIAPDPDSFDWYEPAGDELENPLYDSTRDYVKQVDVYRKHRGDDENVGLAADRVIARTCVVCGASFTSSTPRKVYCSDPCARKAFRRSARERGGGGAPLTK